MARGALERSGLHVLDVNVGVSDVPAGRKIGGTALKSDVAPVRGKVRPIIGAVRQNAGRGAGNHLDLGALRVGQVDRPPRIRQQGRATPEGEPIAVSGYHRPPAARQPELASCGLVLVGDAPARHILDENVGAAVRLTAEIGPAALESDETTIGRDRRIEAAVRGTNAAGPGDVVECCERIVSDDVIVATAGLNMSC